MKRSAEKIPEHKLGYDIKTIMDCKIHYIEVNSTNDWRCRSITIPTEQVRMALNESDGGYMWLISVKMNQFCTAFLILLFLWTSRFQETTDYFIRKNKYQK